MGPLGGAFYGPLLTYLRNELGYDKHSLSLFPYDWRQDCAAIAQVLQRHIIKFYRCCGDRKITLLAHSMGGLIARYCVDVLPGLDQYIEQVITMGTPHKGAPDAFEALRRGAPLPLNWGRRATAKPLRTFPSAYQLLPTGPLLPDSAYFVQDYNKKEIDIFGETERDWLLTDHWNMLREAKLFHQKL